jgi:hypothetical protein
MKIFAVVLVAACFTVSIAGAYIGVYCLPQFLTDDPVLPEAVPVADSVVQMPENQPSQQQIDNPPTQTTPQSTPTATPITGRTKIIHTYIFILKDDQVNPGGYSVFDDIYKFENFYDATYGVGKLNDGDQKSFMCVTVGLFEEATSKQIDFLKQINLNEYGIVYVAEKIPLTTFNGFTNNELLHTTSGDFPHSSGLRAYSVAEFISLFF